MSNMKKMRVFIFLIFSLLLANCNKDEKNLGENSIEKIRTILQTEEDSNFNFSDETYKKLEIFFENKEKVMERLKSLSKEEADKLYDDYLEKNIDVFIEIMETEPFFKKENTPEYFEDEFEKEFQKAKKILNNYGLSIEKSDGAVAMGIIAQAGFYYNIFKNYVSDEYRDYLELTAKDNDIGFELMPKDLNTRNRR